MDAKSNENQTTNWRDSLADDIKEDEILKKYEDVGELAKSHVNLNKVLSSKFEGIGKEDNWETMKHKFSKFNHLPEKESEYDVDAEEHADSVKSFGYKYKLHPKQASGFAKDFANMLKEKEKNIANQELEETKANTDKKFENIKNKDVLVANVANNLGLSVEKLKSSLGRNFFNSTFQDLLYRYGKTLSKEKSGDDSDKIFTTGKVSESSKMSIQDKVDRYSSIVHNHSSKNPYHDPQHPEYMKYRKEVKKLEEEIKEYDRNSEEGVDI